MSLSNPKNIQEALSRLPNRDHTLYKKKEPTIENLAHYREWLEEIILTAPVEVLDERVIRLTLDELELMEQTSFARNPNSQLLFYWSTITDESPWAEVLNENLKDDDAYTFWRISMANLQPEFISTIVFIERCDRYTEDPKRFRDRNIYIVVTSQEELTDLFNHLTPLEGNIPEFLLNTVSWSHISV